MNEIVALVGTKRNVHMNFRQYEPTHLMENVIYNELIRRGYSVDVGVVETRVINKNGVTFIGIMPFLLNPKSIEMF